MACYVPLPPNFDFRYWYITTALNTHIASFMIHSNVNQIGLFANDTILVTRMFTISKVSIAPNNCSPNQKNIKVNIKKDNKLFETPNSLNYTKPLEVHNSLLLLNN